jgi:hypothetical protein
MEETDGVDALVQHPVYHGVCLGFWYTALARGVAAMRNLSGGAIADAIFGYVELPTDPSTRQYVVAACESWRRERHNFWGWYSRMMAAWYGRRTSYRPLF